MPKYSIANPIMLGSLSHEFEAQDINQAAHEAWSKISEHLAAELPLFAFTIKDEDGNLASYSVTEKPNGRFADYTITRIEEAVDVSAEQLDKARKRLEAVAKTMEGGKRKRYEHVERNDSSTSDDDDDDFYDKVNKFKNSKSNNPYGKPIVYWWYTPTLYKLNRFYVPTFIAPLSPYIEVDISSAFLA